MDRITRRTSLLRAGGLVAAVAVGGCASSDSSSSSGASGSASGESAECVLTPEQTEGPYYLDGAKERRDITEGRPGTALALALTVVDAASCKPIGGAAVDVWHCDALGEYSGVDGGGGMFMRGVQRADSRGVARFDTVYPGWYTGRAVHIHVMVHVEGNVVHTGQLYFPESSTDAVYREEPYSSRPGPDVRNAEDAIFASGGRESTLRIARGSGGSYAGALRMGVRA
jgi:protocatechuate 3,4-dioxygenase beta subunit